MAFTDNPLRDHGKHIQNVFGWRENSMGEMGKSFCICNWSKITYFSRTKHRGPAAAGRKVLIFLLLWGFFCLGIIFGLVTEMPRIEWLLHWLWAELSWVWGLGWDSALNRSCGVKIVFALCSKTRKNSTSLSLGTWGEIRDCSLGECAQSHPALGMDSPLKASACGASGICCPRAAGGSSRNLTRDRSPGIEPRWCSGVFAFQAWQKGTSLDVKIPTPQRDGKCSYPEFWLGPTSHCTHSWDNFAKHWAHPAGWFPQVPARMNKERKKKSLYSCNFRPVQRNLVFERVFSFLPQQPNGKGQCTRMDWKKRREEEVGRKSKGEDLNCINLHEK